jgi:hypothetical protein
LFCFLAPGDRDAVWWPELNYKLVFWAAKKQCNICCRCTITLNFKFSSILAESNAIL